MTLTQTHFRFRTDGNAVDATPSWDADEDASPSPATTPFRLRSGLYGTSAASGEFELYAQKNSGSYAAITTSATDGIQSYDASSDADDTALRVPRLTLSVDWQLAGAAIDLDFANNRIYPSGAFTDYLSCSRASDGYAKNSAGSWVQFSSNTLRATDLGSLIEDARTNYLLQSGTPATQTTGLLSTGDYTLWVEGSGSALASGGTATITGASSATDGSPDIFTVTVAGTVTVTVTGTLDRFQLENGSFATSYIPTTTASAVRAADVVALLSSLKTIVEADSDQSIVVDLISIHPLVANQRAKIIGGQVNDSRICGMYNNRAQTFFAGNFAVATDYSAVGTFDAGMKVGYSQNASGTSLVINGETVATGDGHGSISDSCLGGLDQVYWFGYFRRATVWNTRIVDATLQGHTAP